MLKIPVLALVSHILYELLDDSAIFRMSSLQHQFQRGLHRSIELKNPECLLRPKDLTAGNAPSKPPRATELLCLRKVCLAALKLLGQVFLFGHIYRGAKDAFQNSFIEDGNTDTANVTGFAVRSYNALRYVTT